jgi:hypothetical protein
MAVFGLALGGLALSGSSPSSAVAATERVSVSSSGVQGSGSSNQAFDLTPDGRYVLFSSTSRQLNGDVAIPGTNGALFVRDRATETTSRVGGDLSEVYAASISDDGRWVVARAGSGTGAGTVLVDRDDGTLVTLGATGNASSSAERRGVAITGDGATVAYTLADGIARTRSTATGDVVEHGTGWVAAISDDARHLLLDRLTSIVRRDIVDDVDVNPAGVGGTVAVTGLDMSADGSTVVFASSSSAVIRNPDHRSEVFVWQGGTTRTVAFGRQATISALGTTVGFADYATTGQQVLDLADGHIEQAALRADGSLASTGPNPTEMVRLSGDGRLVAFPNSDSTLVTGDTNGSTDVFVRDRMGAAAAGSGTLHGTVTDVDGPISGAVVTASGPLGSLATTTGADGSFTFTDVPAGAWRTYTLVDGHLGTWHPSTQHRSRSLPLLLDDGEDLDASIVAQREDFGPADVVSRTRATPGDGAASGGSTSADGRHVLFSSSSTDLVAGDPGPIADLLVVDRTTGELERVDQTTDGGWPSERATWSAIAADGRHVAFLSAADDLVAGDTDGDTDLFWRDLDAGTTTSLSDAGTPVVWPAPALSADGGLVIYTSGSFEIQVATADGTVTYDGRGPEIQALADGGTQVLRINYGPNGPDVAVTGAHPFSCAACGPAGLSDNGRYLAFSRNGQDVEVRDLVTGTEQTYRMEPYRITVDPLPRVDPSVGWPINERVRGLRISDDGQRVAIEAMWDFAEPVDDVRSGSNVFVLERSTGTFRRLSVGNRNESGSGYEDHLADLSADGSTVTIQTANGLESTDDDRFDDVVAIDLVGDRGPTPGTGSIRGTVRKAGVPLAGAIVRAITTNSIPERRALAVTAPDGTYRIYGLPAGQSFRIHAADPNGAAIGRYAPAATPLWAAATYAVTDGGQTTADVALEAAPAPPPTPSATPAGLLVTPDASDEVTPAVSADGRWVAYRGVANDLWIVDRLAAVAPRRVDPASTASGRALALAMSDDGARLAFTSTQPDLVAGDTNGVADAFVVERSTGAVSRVSLSVNGAQLTEATLGVSISGDGTTISFTTGTKDATSNVSRIRTLSPAAQIGQISGVSGNAFVLDRTAAYGGYATTTSGFFHSARVWIRATGATFEAGYHLGSRVRVQGIGAYGSLLWTTEFGPRDPYGTGPADGAYVSQMGEPAQQVDVATGGLEAGSDVREAQIDASGRFVVFRSAGRTLGPNANPVDRLWVRDLLTRTTTALPDGLPQALTTRGAPFALSGDGNSVVYARSGLWAVPVPGSRVPSAPSSAVATVDNDTAFLTWKLPVSNGGSAISVIQIRRYENDVATATQVVTVSPTTTSRTFPQLSFGSTQRFEVVAINANGTSAVAASGTVSMGNGGTLRTTVIGPSGPVVGATVQVLANATSTTPVAVGTSATGGIAQLNVPAGTYRIRVVPPTAAAAQIGWTGGGPTAATGWVAVNTGATTNATVTVAPKGASAVVSLNTAGQYSGINHSTMAIDASGDGRWVTFTTPATLLSSSGSVATSQVWLKDTATGALHRVTTSTAGGYSNGVATLPQVSDDGRYVAYLSTGTDLTSSDTETKADVFVWDRTTGSTRLVSFGQGFFGSVADLNAPVTGLALSGGGSTIAYVSTATNTDWTASDTANPDIFIAPVSAGTTIRRLTPDSYTPVLTSITRNGGTVSFTTLTSLLAGDSDGASSLYLMGTSGGPLTLASPHPVGGGAQANDGVISADGTTVVFRTATPVIDSGNNVFQAYRHVLATGSITRASHDGRGAAGRAVQDYAVSGDGKRVAFSVLQPELVDAVGVRNAGISQTGTFVSDSDTGQIEVVNVVMTGSVAAGNGSTRVVLDDTGDRGAFVTTESLFSGDLNGSTDAFTWTRGGGPSITTTTLPAGTTGAAYSGTLAGTGTNPLAWSLASGGLPNGLSLASSGAITGTPTSSGTSSFVVRLTQSGGRTATRSLSIAVAVPPTITSVKLPDGKQLSPYSQLLAGSGGTTPYSWSLVGGTLPPGLSLTASTGRVSGTPTQAGSWAPELRLTDSVGRTVDKVVPITIYPPLAVSPGAPPPLLLDEPYQHQLESTGGAPGHTWTIASGTFPAGISLSSAGLISGTPTTAGTSLATVRVTDANGTTATRDLTFTVTPIVASIEPPASIVEGGPPATFTVRLSAPSHNQVSIPWATVDGTATSPADLTAASGTAVIPAGSTSTTLEVAITADRTFEQAEQFRVDLGTPSAANVVVPSASGYATITDDDIDPGASWRETSGFSVSDTRVVEGGVAQVAITRSGDLSEVASVKWATANGTAVAPGELTAQATTNLSFLPGVQSRTVTVPTVAIPGSLATDRAFSVVLSAPSNADLSDSLGTVTILDAGTDPAWYAIRDASVAEGQPASVTIVRGGDTSMAGTVQVSTQNSSAQTGRDYVGLPATVVPFAAGESSQTVSVATIDDAVDLTSNRVFRLLLGSATNGRPADSLATVTIIDDEGAPIAAPSTFVSVDPVRVVEGDVAVVRVRRRGNLAGTSNVKIATGAGASPWGAAAVAASDFTAVPLTTVVFGVGVDHVDVPITTLQDAEGELDEAIPVNLTTAISSTIEAAQAFVTIRDDDVAQAPPSVSVRDVRVLENQAAVFRIVRAGDTTLPVTVSWATGDESATAPADYVASPVATPVTIPAGQTEVTVSVATVRDDVSEPNETFRITVSAPSAGSTIADAVGQAQVTDSGWEPPAYLVSDTNVVEGGLATFTVTRTGDRSQPGSVTVATANGTATAPGDYTAKAATVVAFAAGEATKTVTVQTAQNAVDVAANKAFKLTITAAANGAVWDAEAVATIVDDDGPQAAAPATWFSVDDQRVAEGGTITLTVTRRGDTTGTSTVSVRSVNGTAVAGSDFNTVAPTTLTFAPGETTRTIVVTIRTDAVAERHETFTLVLSAPVGATIEDDKATVTIHDND